MILDQIIEKKKIRLQMQKEFIPKSCILRLVDDRKTKDFYAALNQEKIAVIAEVKKASPSRGIIKKDFNHVGIANKYTKYGANAISVLTEKDFFLGSDQYLKDIKKVSNLPILRKDFIVDEYQIYQAKAMGADAVLLIAAILDDKQLNKFYSIAKQLELTSLVEAHTEEEVKRAAQIGARIIGINNRNLKTFEVDIHTTERLMRFVPNGTLTVSESGIQTREDVVYLESLGVNALLIGETLMRAEDIEFELNRLRGK